MPLSERFLEVTFGNGAFQAPSSCSVVIIDESSAKVYKHCLSPEDVVRLSKLRDSSHKPQYSVFPEAIKSVPGMIPIDFYEYPLFRPPLEQRKHVAMQKCSYSVSVKHLKNFMKDFT